MTKKKHSPSFFIVSREKKPIATLKKCKYRIEFNGLCRKKRMFCMTIKEYGKCLEYET